MLTMRVAVATVHLFGVQMTGGFGMSVDPHLFSSGRTPLVAMQEALTAAMAVKKLGEAFGMETNDIFLPLPDGMATQLGLAEGTVLQATRMRMDNSGEVILEGTLVGKNLESEKNLILVGSASDMAASLGQQNDTKGAQLLLIQEKDGFRAVTYVPDGNEKGNIRLLSEGTGLNPTTVRAALNKSELVGGLGAKPGILERAAESTIEGTKNAIKAIPGAETIMKMGTDSKDEKATPTEKPPLPKVPESLFEQLAPMFTPGAPSLPGMGPLKVQTNLVETLFANASEILGKWDFSFSSAADKEAGASHVSGTPNLLQSIGVSIRALAGAIKNFFVGVYEKVADLISGRSAQGLMLKDGVLYSKGEMKSVMLQTSTGGMIPITPGEEGVIGKLENGKIVIGEGVTVNGVAVLGGMITMKGGTGRVESLTLPIENVGSLNVPGGMYRLDENGKGWLDLPGQSLGLPGGTMTISAESLASHDVTTGMAYLTGQGTWKSPEGQEFTLVRVLNIEGDAAGVVLNQGGILYVAAEGKMENVSSISSRIRESAKIAVVDMEAVNALESRVATVFSLLGVTNPTEKASHGLLNVRREAENNLEAVLDWANLGETGQWELAAMVSGESMNLAVWESRVASLERGGDRLAKAETLLKQVEGNLTESGLIRVEMQAVKAEAEGLFRAGIRDLVKSNFSEAYDVLNLKASWAEKIVNLGVDFELAKREARNDIAIPAAKGLITGVMKWPGAALGKVLDAVGLGGKETNQYLEMALFPVSPTQVLAPLAFGENKEHLSAMGTLGIAKGVDFTEDLDALAANGDMDAKLLEAFNVYRLAKWGYDKTEELYDKPAWVRVSSVGLGLMGRASLELVNWLVPVVRFGAVTAVVVEDTTTNIAMHYGAEKESAKNLGGWVGLGSAVLFFAGAGSATTKATDFFGTKVEGAFNQFGALRSVASSRHFVLGSGKEFGRALGISIGIVGGVEGGLELGGKALGWTRLQIDDAKDVGFMVAGSLVAKALEVQAKRLNARGDNLMALARSEAAIARNEARLGIEKNIESVMSSGVSVPAGKTEYNGRLYTKLETKAPAGMLEHNGRLYKAIGDGKQPSNPRLLENLLSKGGLNANVGRNSQLAEVEDLGILLQRARGGGERSKRAETKLFESETRVFESETRVFESETRVQRYRDEARGAYAKAIRLENWAKAFDSAEAPEGWDPPYSRFSLRGTDPGVQAGPRATNLLREAQEVVIAAWRRGTVQQKAPVVDTRLR